MARVDDLASKMRVQIEPETGLLALGVAIAFFALFAFVAQYFELSSSISADKFFLTPYLKFAYVSFLKPHTGQADGGQQSALESFYSAQVGIITSQTWPLLIYLGLNLRCHQKAAPSWSRGHAWLCSSATSSAYAQASRR